MDKGYKLIVENWNKFLTEEKSNEKPRLNFYEDAKGFTFSDAGGFGDKPIDIEELVAKLREGGLTAGGSGITKKRDVGVVIDMGVVRGGATEDYENLMQKIAERLKDNFSLTFRYSDGPKMVTKEIG